MRIGIDALGLQTTGGARNATLGWLKALANASPDIEYVTFLSRSEVELAAFSNITPRVITGLGSRLRLRLWAQLNLPFLLRREKIELVHFMKNLSVFCSPHPCVVTILDMNRFKFPEGYSKVDILLWRTIQPHLLRNADRIIAISENTKKDLLTYYKLPPEKIHTIYPGISSKFHDPVDARRISQVLEKYGIRPPYILSVGGLAVHKNVHTTLCAFRSLLDRGHLAEYTFVVVGEKTHTHQDRRLYELAQRSDLPYVRFTGAVSDTDLLSIFAGASLFVYPSIYEGFGLAPIEAMARGIPVLASSAGPLPEVLGEGAWLIQDPTDVKAFAEGMLQILTNSQTNRQLAERGLENAKRFSWDLAVQETLALYHQLLQA